jgi:type IV secretion system protein VirB8
MTASTPAAHIFERSRGFEAQTADDLERSRRTAWRVAAGACALATALTVALIVSLAVKEVRVGILEFDRGGADSRWVELGQTVTISQSEILDKHWIAAYVMAREGYHWGTLQTAYDTVLTMSEGEPERTYKEDYSPNNPVAIDKQLGAAAERRLRVLSITLPPGEPGRAVARIERTTVRNGGVSAPERFVATLAYAYKPATSFGQKIKEKSAVLNPLGFKVGAYRIDAEFAARPGVPASATGVTP